MCTFMQSNSLYPPLATFRFGSECCRHSDIDGEHHSRCIASGWGGQRSYCIMHTWQKSIFILCDHMCFIWIILLKKFSISYIQMARLQNSLLFGATSELDFQRDMVGSINMLLCEKRLDFNSTNLSISLRSPIQMANGAISPEGNSSSKCCRLYLCPNHLSTLAYIRVPFVVMVTIKWKKKSNVSCIF